MEKKTKVCPTCKGDKFIDNGFGLKDFCYTCNGTGEVPVEEKNCKNYFHFKKYDNQCEDCILLEYWQPIKEPQPQINSGSEEMVKAESKSPRKILEDNCSEELWDIIEQKDRPKELRYFKKFIIDAMKEFSLQSNQSLLESLEKEFKSRFPEHFPAYIQTIIEILNKYKTK